MQNALKPSPHVDFCFSWLNHTIVLYTPSLGFFIFAINQVFLLNPKMMSDFILLSHTDLPPVVLVLVPQSPRVQHMSPDTQLARAYDPLSLDGFHPHAVTQICHLNMSILPLHITCEESWGWVNLTPSWDAFLGTRYIHGLSHTCITWMVKIIMKLSCMTTQKHAYLIWIHCGASTAQLHSAVFKSTECIFVFSLSVNSAQPKF